jgi:type I restriction enzyme, R subunit
MSQRLTLLTAGIGAAADIDRAREPSQGPGRFVRSLIGLDRAAGTATAA